MGLAKMVKTNGAIRFLGLIIMPLLIIAAAMFFVPALHAQPTNINGRLSVSFSTEAVDTSELEALIKNAEALISSTRISADGRDILPSEYWATETAHMAFCEAIEIAQATLQKLREREIRFNETAGTIYPLSPGQSFTMTLRIEENTGFANMPIRLFVPEGLELTHVSSENLPGMMFAFPPGHLPETGEIDTITGAAYAFVISAGGSNFSVPNADLLSFTFRVRTPATISETAPIRIAFANAARYSTPTTADGVPLNIMLPGNDSGIIGNVIISAHN
jgi:hypothetical protein